MTKYKIAVCKQWRYCCHSPSHGYVKLHQPHMLCCHCLPPGSLHVLGAFGSLSYHLKWYKIVCMRYLACTFSQMKSINMFSMFLQCGVPRHFLNGDLLRFEHITSLFSCLCMSMLTYNSSSSMQKHGYLGCFHAASARENISGVCVIVKVIMYTVWCRF